MPHEDAADKDLERMLNSLRDGYNPPPSTPREEMWAEIQGRLTPRPERESEGGDPSASSPQARPSRRPLIRPGFAWAAAAILVLGLGIGRWTAPLPSDASSPSVSAEPVGSEKAGRYGTDPLRRAAVQHLGRTEDLLTLVQADARSGGVEPGTAGWAERLLSQTRLLLDAPGTQDPVIRELLRDLELILVQVVGAANAREQDPDSGRSELNLTLEGLEQNDVLPRIRAVLPEGNPTAGA